MNNKITELNELISQLQTRNTDLLKKVTEKEEEINKLKFDLDHLNTFIITEIRNHVEEIDKLENNIRFNFGLYDWSNKYRIFS